MKRFIDITKTNREFIMTAFKVDERTVRYALSYTFNSDLCKRIRKLAIERGGVKMVTVEEAECIHDADGVMTQLLPNGAIIKGDKNSGVLTVYFKGVPMIVVDNPRLSEIPAIQKSALVLK